MPMMPLLEAEYAIWPIWPSMPAYRGGVDDDAALPVGVGGLGLGHGRGGDPHHVEGPEQVDRDDPLEGAKVVRGAVAPDGPRRPADARAADPGPQWLPGGHREVHRGLHRRLVGHVGAGELAADLVRDLLAAALVQVGDDHRDARRGERPRGRLAEAARAAGNDRRSTVELHAGSIPAAVSAPHQRYAVGRGG
jgi:hypothetical protein